MRMVEFRGAGYKTVSGALRKLEQVQLMAGTASALVATCPLTGKFYPVVVYRDGNQGCDVGQLVRCGVYVVN